LLQVRNQFSNAIAHAKKMSATKVNPESPSQYREKHQQRPYKNHRVPVKVQPNQNSAAIDQAKEQVTEYVPKDLLAHQ
jgi:hypothetical protein